MVYFTASSNIGLVCIGNKLKYTNRRGLDMEKKRSIFKRIWALILVVIMALSLTACGGKFTCDVCGKEKTGKSHSTELFGQKVLICDDCYESLGVLGNLF